MTARLRVILSAALTWITAASGVASMLAADAGKLVPGPLADDVNAWALRIVAWLVFAAAAIRRVTPVAPIDRGVLPPSFTVKNPASSRAARRLAAGPLVALALAAGPVLPQCANPAPTKPVKASCTARVSADGSYATARCYANTVPAGKCYTARGWAEYTNPKYADKWLIGSKWLNNGGTVIIYAPPYARFTSASSVLAACPGRAA